MGDSSDDDSHNCNTTNLGSSPQLGTNSMIVFDPEFDSKPHRPLSRVISAPVQPLVRVQYLRSML